jgi:4-hydroxy-3-methylbut-2-enyl diphosphate reductase
LKSIGIKTVKSVDEIPSGKDVICIIRTHGAPPDIFKKLEGKACQVVDATCIDVKKVQEKAKSLIQEGYKLIIIGKPDHPEVVGIKAHAEENTNKKALVLSSEEEALQRIDEIKKEKKIGIVIQTTQKTENLTKILPILAENAKEIKAFNTICTTTSNRQKEAKNLAEETDLMVVVGSRSSANTSHLFEILREITPTIHIETEKELEEYTELIEKSKNIGVTAGASTPENIIEKVIDTIKMGGNTT